MTNPAPICVLDEVDAPLDDSNVERFCDLVAEIATHSDTRFLIITHHRVTMAKMHRLYGVTMAERGVSTLVSVDLEHAAGIGVTYRSLTARRRRLPSPRRRPAWPAPP
jgi:chromosome segregation protein